MDTSLTRETTGTTTLVDKPKPDFTTDQTLQIDFSWKKWKSSFTAKSDPSGPPRYVVDYTMFSRKGPHLKYYREPSHEMFGSATLGGISIDASLMIHSQPSKLHALKKIKTSYAHNSIARPGQVFTWSDHIDLKHWEFLCLDDKQLPVAKLTANWWAVKQIGMFEFVEGLDEELREEMIVAGTTLMYLMCLRMNNPLQLFGSAFHKTGEVGEGKEIELEAKKEK